MLRKINIVLIFLNISAFLKAFRSFQKKIYTIGPKGVRALPGSQGIRLVRRLPHKLGAGEVLTERL